MKLRYSILVVTLILAVVALIVVTVSGGGDEVETTDTTDQDHSTADDDAEPNGTDARDPTTTSDDFVGLPIEEATAIADGEARPWRIAREDEESFALTDDLRPGRVTFEVDDGIVTTAVIEAASTPSNEEPVPTDPARAELLAAAVGRIVTIDNGFGGAEVFDEVRVARVIGSDPNRPLTDVDLDAIAAALAGIDTVLFVDDADREIESLFDESPTGVSVVSVEDLVQLDDGSDVALRLWCGSLCGVFLTYEAVPVDGGWEITGTTGPIAMS